jgi:hypothetical protein
LHTYYARVYTICYLGEFVSNVGGAPKPRKTNTDGLPAASVGVIHST